VKTASSSCPTPTGALAGIIQDHALLTQVIPDSVGFRKIPVPAGLGAGFDLALNFFAGKVVGFCGLKKLLRISLQ
jgi:hypothetical protein